MVKSSHPGGERSFAFQHVYALAQALKHHGRALSLITCLASTLSTARAAVGVYGADYASNLSNVVSTIQSTSAGSLGTVLEHRLCIAQEPCEATPTLAQLQAYTAVLVYSNFNFADPVAMGNVLADYVDAGGTVALAAFGLTMPSEWGISGRLSTGDYLPLIQGSRVIAPVQSFIPVQPNHPLLQGVNSFNGGSHRSAVSLASGATLVATWNDASSTPLIAVKGSVVALNFFPPSSTVQNSYWDPSTDGGRIMVNALSWYPLAINAISLTNGQVGSAYPVTNLSATGTNSPFTWTATGLPNGMSLSTAGVLTGTPTSHGTFSVAVTVTDSATPPVTHTQTLPIVIDPAALALTTTSLAPAMVGTFYTQAIVATGGTDLSITVTGLPEGLSFDAATGLITGTPTSYTPVPATITITVSDPVAATLTQTMSLAVNPEGLSISQPITVPDATVGQPYSLALQVSGGVAPYTWIAAGLPAGLTINTSTGEITGTPTDAKSVSTSAQAKAVVSTTVTVTDSLNVQANLPLSLTVNAAPVIAPTPVPTLNQWTLALLGMLAAGLGLGALRRK